LDNEHVFTANIVLNLDTHFTITEATNFGVAKIHSQTINNPVCQGPMGIARENL
jgi:hypothetical protein